MAVDNYTNPAGLGYFAAWVKSLVDNLRDSVRGMMYDVGDVIITTNDTNPATRYGGTWERFAQGRTLFGYDISDPDYDTIGKTLGAKSRTLTAGQIPELDVYMRTYRAGKSMGEEPCGALRGHSSYMLSARDKVGSTGDQSSTQPIDIRPPGVVVYFWRKIPNPNP